MDHVLLVGGFGQLDRPFDEFDKAGAEVTIIIEPKHLPDSVEDSGHDVIVVEDVSNAENVISGLYRHGLDLSKFNIICALNENSIVTSSILAAACHASGIDISTAVALRDKSVQKRQVRERGIPVALCREETLLSRLAVDDLEFPVVVKPISGVATRNTYVLRSAAELARLRSREELASAGPWLIESFIRGIELHIDGIVENGKIKFQSVSRYLQPVIDMRNNGVVGSITLDPGNHAYLYMQLRNLLNNSLEAIGHRDGVFHAEVFDDGGSLTFSECAGRIGGGLISQVVSFRYNIDLVSAWAATILHRAHDIKPTLDRPTCGWVQLPTSPGRVISIPAAADLLELPGCVYAKITLKEGTVVSDTGHVNRTAGVIMVEGCNEDEVEQILRQTTSWFESRMVIADPSSNTRCEEVSS